jgi:hypothetical protein
MDEIIELTEREKRVLDDDLARVNELMAAVSSGDIQAFSEVGNIYPKLLGKLEAILILRGLDPSEYRITGMPEGRYEIRKVT